MQIRNKDDIRAFIQEDKWMMDILASVKLLNLPDWWVCAGFVRSKIWDVLHDFDEKTPLPDIDVIYYDQAIVEEKEEKRLEEQLKDLMPTIPWSVKNQARMHIENGIPPYTSAEDAIAKFPETATALGVKLDEGNHVILTAPHGVQDIVNLVVRPTPYFFESEERMLIYAERVRKKNWQSIWGQVDVIGWDVNRI